MSDRNPYEELGIKEDASFEEIQEAKGRLLQEHRSDRKLQETIETAYDAILMDRLRMRQQGRIKVPEDIQFPERLSQSPPNFPSVPINISNSWMQRLLDTPSRSELLWTSGVFFALIGLVALPGFQASALSLAIALGGFATFYFLQRKEHQFGRSLLLTLVGLFVGIGLGSLIGTWLSPSLISIGMTSDKLATLATLIVLWPIASFLR
jgi:hypothetical protein